MLASVVWLGFLLLLAPRGDAASEAPVTLRVARLAASLDGQASPPRDIELPLHWDVAYPGRSGSAELTLAFDLPPGAAATREPYALFITRIGGAHEIELNGILLSSAGTLLTRNDRWTAKYPVSLSFPSRLLASHNELRIRIRADAGYRAGLAPIVVGPAQAVEPIAKRADLLRVGLPVATAVLSLLVACFCALLWWQQRDRLYAWAGLGEALWAVTVADTVLETAPLPWPYWGFALLFLRAAWSWSLYAIAEEVCGRHPRVEYWTMLSVQSGIVLCVLLMAVLQSTRPLLVWYAINFLTWVWVVFRLAVQGRRKPTPERIMILVALVAVLAASVRDAVAGRFDASLYDESAWAKYVAVLIGASLMWIVSRRFLQARSETARLHASLERRVEQKELELRDSFARLSEVERSRAVLAERERILRDMHDGVGSTLATAVRQLEGGRAQPHEVMQTLRESMDHLKLSIDAMNLPTGDVNALLASLRYRLQPRLESAGLVFGWDVEQLPHWTSATDSAMRHLQFLLLEVISNVLQHARASTLNLAACDARGDIRIALSDDGLGVQGPAGRGLGSLQARADSIGARLSIEPAAPGTRVTITLPKASSGEHQGQRP